MAPNCTYYEADAETAHLAINQDPIQMSGALLAALPAFDSNPLTSAYGAPLHLPSRAPPLPTMQQNIGLPARQGNLPPESQDMYGDDVASRNAIDPTVPSSHRAPLDPRFRHQAFPSRQVYGQPPQAQYSGLSNLTSRQREGYQGEGGYDAWPSNVTRFGGPPAPLTRTATGAEKRDRGLRSSSGDSPRNHTAPAARKAAKKPRQESANEARLRRETNSKPEVQVQSQVQSQAQAQTYWEHDARVQQEADRAAPAAQAKRARDARRQQTANERAQAQRDRDARLQREEDEERAEAERSRGRGQKKR